MNRFAINHTALPRWLDQQLADGSQVNISPAWYPLDFGQEATIYDLVHQPMGRSSSRREG